MVRVVNVRGLRTQEERAGIVYVSRAWAGWPWHPLGNPFAIRNEHRDTDIARYRDWLLARPTLEADLAELWEETERGELPLGCWCSPNACHADVLAQLLAERFAG